MAIEPQMGLNFEQVWAALMELREAQKETARQLKESSVDFDRRMKETDKEIKALTKNIGGLNNSLGELIEQLFFVQLWDKFDTLGYEFTKAATPSSRRTSRS
jgi:hypothetical protein